jgi:hypothetical protein
MPARSSAHISCRKECKDILDVTTSIQTTVLLETLQTASSTARVVWPTPIYTYAGEHGHVAGHHQLTDDVGLLDHLRKHFRFEHADAVSWEVRVQCPAQQGPGVPGHELQLVACGLQMRRDVARRALPDRNVCGTLQRWS